MSTSGEFQRAPSLFYGKNLEAIGGDGYTRLVMQPIADPIDTPLGRQRTWRATIPAVDVTTTGLAYYIKAHDGYTTGYGPGTFYSGYYVPLDGTRGADVDHEDQLVVSGSTFTIDAAGASVRIGSGEDESDGGTSRALSLSAGAVYPLRVLEPPHPVFVTPYGTVERDQELDVEIVTNCATPPCTAELVWQPLGGDAVTVAMDLVDELVEVDGVARFAVRLPRTATGDDALTLQAHVDDGYVVGSTPLSVVAPESATALSELDVTVQIEPIDAPAEPYPSVNAILTGPGVDGLWGTPDDTAQTRTSEADGLMRFTRLLEGDYRLEVDTDTLIPGLDLTDATTDITIGRLRQHDTTIGFPLVDTDNDGVLDYYEHTLEFAPGLFDTDSDGLSDATEINLGLGLVDPTTADGDGDGILDAAEDFDGDGLGLADELAAGADPFVADSDGDGLADGAEIVAGTLPLVADSDGDGLSDAAELDNGLNPLAADSDGDGIPDVDDTNTIVADVADTAPGVVIELTGTGDLAGAITVVPRDVQPGWDGSVLGPVVDIELDDSLATLFSADLTLPVPTALRSDQSELTLFTLDSAGRSWVPAALPQDVSVAPDGASVTASVPHFSPWRVGNLSRWLDSLFVDFGCAAEDPDPVDPSLEPAADVFFAIDDSGSMAWVDPQRHRASAVANAVVHLEATDRAAAMMVKGYVHPIGSDLLTFDLAGVAAAVQAHPFDENGGNSYYGAVSRSNARWEYNLPPGDGPARSRHLIIIGDEGQGFTIYDPALGIALDLGVRLHTISLQDENPNFADVSAQSGGRYFGSVDPSNLDKLLIDLVENLDRADPLPPQEPEPSEPSCEATCPGETSDVDGDGLLDCEEQEGFLTTELDGLVKTNPILSDTDGDGLLDGAEVVAPVGIDLSALYSLPNGVGETIEEALPGLGIRIVRQAVSDPRVIDTDEDGLDDAIELDAGTSPLARDTDGDRLGDAVELEIHGTDPTVIDTDGDGFDDHAELHGLRLRGFDPLVPDEAPLSAATALGHLTLGALCPGSFGWCQRETGWWFIGHVGVGFAFVGDVRDLLGGFIARDGGQVVLAGVGFVPGIGDSAKVIDTANALIKRLEPKKLQGFVEFVARFEDLSDSAKIKIFRAIGRADFEAAYGTLLVRRMDDTDIIRLLSRRSNIVNIARALDAGAVIKRIPLEEGIGFTPRGAERFTRQQTPGSLPVGRKIVIPKDKITTEVNASRLVDVYRDAGEVITLKEVKAGYNGLRSRIRREVNADAALVDGTHFDENLFYEATWVFVPNSRGRVMPAQTLIDEIDRVNQAHRAAGKQEIVLEIWIPSAE